MVMEAGKIAIAEGRDSITKSDCKKSLEIIEENRKDPIRANHEGLYG